MYIYISIFVYIDVDVPVYICIYVLYMSHLGAHSGTILATI